MRDKSKREVDFAITKNGRVIELLEAKNGDTSPTSSLLYYADKLDPDRATLVTAARRVSQGAIRRGKLMVSSPIEAFSSLDKTG